ncbi:E3 ubiquitin/ISG15 ligase TRIM25-like [Mantella aurantiaca]
MASVDLRAELKCSICKNIYKDPVTLHCGHSFCRLCIDHMLDTQKDSGDYFCPVCRKRFRSRPALHKNITLHIIAQQYQEESGVFCTYCLDSSVPAVKSCLQCDAYLCDKHLTAHNKAPEHVLSDPTTSLQTRKCPTHKELIQYYCIKDRSCICESCKLYGEHRGHQVGKVDEASEKKKKKLRNVLQKLLTKREETEERVRSLQEHGRKVERVLRKISRRAEEVSLAVLNMIRDLEIKKDELSRKIHHIQELCNMTDPLTVLQESDSGDFGAHKTGKIFTQDYHHVATPLMELQQKNGVSISQKMYHKKGEKTKERLLIV